MGLGRCRCLGHLGGNDDGATCNPTPQSVSSHHSNREQATNDRAGLDSPQVGTFSSVVPSRVLLSTVKNLSLTYPRTRPSETMRKTMKQEVPAGELTRLHMALGWPSPSLGLRPLSGVQGG